MKEKFEAEERPAAEVLSLKQRVWWAIFVLAGLAAAAWGMQLIPGQVDLGTRVDGFLPLWGIWVVPFFFIFLWWAAALVWAFWQMDGAMYKALGVTLLIGGLSSAMFYILIPVRMPGPMLVGEKWAMGLAGFIQSGGLPYVELRDLYVVVSGVLGIFWWYWKPNYRWIWFSTVVLAVLAAVFTKQNTVIGVLLGLLWAFGAFTAAKMLVRWQLPKSTFDYDTGLRFLTRIFWLWTILYMIFAALTYRTLPVDGVTGDLTSFGEEGYLVKWVIDTRPGGLEVGDIVVGMEGISFDDWLHGRAEISDTWFTGGEVIYEVLRDGTAETLEITLQPDTVGAMAKYYGVQFVGIIVLVFISSLIFWMRQDYPAARWFMVLCLSSAAHMVGDAWNFQLVLLARPYMFWMHFVNEQASFIMIHVAAFMQALTFPRSLALLERSKLRIILGVIGISLLPTFGVLFFWSPLGVAFDISNRLSLVWSAVFLTVAVVVGFVRLRRIDDSSDSDKLKWWIYIGGVALFILVPFYYLPIIISGNPILPPLVASGISMVGLPIALSVAMLDVRLYGIDFLINRSLVYGALTYVLTGIFGLSLYGINHLASSLTGEQQSILAVIVSAVVFVGVFRPVRKRLQLFVDRRLFRIGIDYGRLEKVRKEIEGIAVDIRRDFLILPFEQMEYLGRGGMAVTYKAINPGSDEEVTIKFLLEHLSNESQYRARFQHEAETLQMIDHPNIVRLLDQGETEKVPYMVLEHMEGMTLAQHIMMSGRLSVERALEIAQDIALAVDHVHEKQIVHRDIKPENIMLALDADSPHHEYRAVLMDFGIAMQLKRGGEHIAFDEIVGSFDYIAPEQIEEALSIDHRADIYSLGLVVYQMVTGKLPFKIDRPGAQLMAHIREEPIDPKEFEPSLPEGFSAAILKAIDKDPDNRFDSAGEFVSALRG